MDIYPILPRPKLSYPWIKREIRFLHYPTIAKYYSCYPGGYPTKPSLAGGHLANFNFSGGHPANFNFSRWHPVKQLNYLTRASPLHSAPSSLILLRYQHHQPTSKAQPTPFSPLQTDYLPNTPLCQALNFTSFPMPAACLLEISSLDNATIVRAELSSPTPTPCICNSS